MPLADRFRRLILALAVLLLAGRAAAVVRAEVDFESTVAPLLAKRCVVCHNAADRKGGLDLTHRESALNGGDSGQVIVPGRPDDSLLWQQVTNGEMPPKNPLPDSEQAVLREWLTAGAPWSGGALDPFRFTSDIRAGYDWWSLQPLRVPEWPPADTSRWMDNTIDRLVLAGLSKAQLRPSPPADRRVLIRRLYYDLLGLPPTPDEVTAFLADQEPFAYEKLVDRVLASPQYGERWARHWLDIVRFGESQGFERDKLRLNSWRYRDWVIAALNGDLSYRDFARLQLAGDVLQSDTVEGAIATGFLVAGPYDEVGQSQQSEAMRAVVREDELEDIVSTVGQTFLGLTVNCGRCHDHKFDPVRQVEYYRLSAALAGVRHGERDVPGEQLDARAAAPLADIAARLRVLESLAAAMESPVRERLVAERAVSEDELAAGLSPEQRSGRDRWRAEIEHLRQQAARLRQTKIYAVMPKPPPPTYVLERGNPLHRGELASPGGIASLRGLTADFALPPDSSDAERRRHLADWLTHERNPLFARVLVNRLWHYHFGVGLVDTPNDFGFNGGRPSHPELIDWLAHELVRGGWSVKLIQRLIVTSATYRQSSTFRKDAAQLDAGNRLLWRKSPARLEAEALRDTMLMLAGELDFTMCGPGFFDFTTFTRNTQFYEMRDPVGASFQRRSIYRTWVRSGRSPFLDVFDCPDPSTKSPQRAVTTTPLQALSLRNNSFVLRMSERFAARVEQEVGDDPMQQIDAVFAYAYGRVPEAVEHATCEALIRQHGLATLCRVVFNSNEFVFID